MYKFLEKDSVIVPVIINARLNFLLYPTSNQKTPSLERSVSDDVVVASADCSVLALCNTINTNPEELHKVSGNLRSSIDSSHVLSTFQSPGPKQALHKCF